MNADGQKKQGRFGRINIGFLGYLTGNGELSKVFSNIGWLTSERILRMTFGLFVGVWVARYLGPDKFGQLSYAVAFVGLLEPLYKLGLDGIITRDIVRTPDSRDEILGTALILKVSGALLIVVIAGIAVYQLHAGKTILYSLVALLAVRYVLKTAEVIEFWFRSQVASKYSSLAQNSAIVITNVFKIILILLGAGLVFFGAAYLFEAAVALVFLVAAYKIYGGVLKNWRFNSRRARSMLSECWPLIISGLFVQAYLKVDQVMLGQMLDSRSVGLYSAVVTLSGFSYFVPQVVTWSLQPYFVSVREKDEKLYYRRLQDIFSLLVLCTYGITVPVFLFSHKIMTLVYGNKYIAAAPVLAVHIFASVFVFLGVARGLWVLTESFFLLNLFSNVTAGLSNIALNFFLINRYGIIGAAYATLISYFIAHVGLAVLFSRARRVFFMQMKSLLLLDSYRLFKNAFARGTASQ